MRTLATLLTFLFLVFNLAAQNINPAAGTTLKFESFSGTNGTAVVYNPVLNIYYAAIAGNPSFPFEGFDRNGKHLFSTECRVDLRGMWWSDRRERLEANTYNDPQILVLDTDVIGQLEGSTQNYFKLPQELVNGNSVGAYYNKKDELLFLDNDQVLVFSCKKPDQEPEILQLELPVSWESINKTTVMCTNEKKMEVALLDFENNKLYLFHRKKGTLTATVNLPRQAVTNSRFRVSFANGHLWLFDVDERTWTGYKIF